MRHLCICLVICENDSWSSWQDAHGALDLTSSDDELTSLGRANGFAFVRRHQRNKADLLDRVCNRTMVEG